MRDGLIWALVIVACVAAGWLWNDWRRRAAERAGTRDRADGRRDRADGRRPGTGRGSRTGGPDGDRSGTDRPGGGRRGDRAGTGPRGDRTATPPRPRGAGRADRDEPWPGDIWWADVPYADGSGSKVRPCLVLRVDGRDAEVLKITSQDKSDRDDHLPIPTRDWDPGADHDSYLDVSEPIPVPLSAFADRAGTCDPDLWRGVRRLSHLAG
ncbi:type II toxin-antitoxin system PemK/MazF family toxin [Micromonospora sp. C28ISP2-4]|uniref:type II toxin-antitoxin system PemK/MazF family toxin n=1 Tax=Micromonospora sp. C28ISP2-4 TaxID=3059523 RepID=UPI0026774890|nr:type II toxin-antitoxin system PemK/MazF family toxin [Micromonospora sp. C28ISP2-4]MDO3682643.1 type II toxin-antitoxin system PemK/MazF family toxin [Micromonospora sp. C28ISP2-4]